MHVPLSLNNMAQHTNVGQTGQAKAGILQTDFLGSQT